MSYEEWTVEQLRAACKARGLDEKLTLVARLESFDAARVASVTATNDGAGGQRKRGREAEATSVVALHTEGVPAERQRARDDTAAAASKRTQDVEAASDALLEACRDGVRRAVVKALNAGANVNCFDQDDVSPLMHACSLVDWTVAHRIVRLLLRCGAIARTVNRKGWTALHSAALWSSPAIVQLLINYDARTGALSDSNEAPLCLCLRRTADNGVEVATLLLENDASTGCADEDRNTPLLLACRSSSVEMVQLMLSYSCEEEVNIYNETALMLACRNDHGAEMIPLLVESGVDVKAVDNMGRTAVHHAALHSARMLRALAPHVPHGKQLENWIPPHDCPDPIGVISAAAVFGCRPRTRHFVLGALDNAAEYCWSILRSTDVALDRNDIFGALAQSRNTRLWELTLIEMSIPRHPFYQQTLLHVAAAADNLEGVRACCARHVNPLLLNLEGRLAVQLTSDVTIRAILLDYMVWRPTRVVTQWFGPYFQRRAREWLLVCVRWNRDGTRVVQRDAQMLILKILAFLEESFVSSA